MTYLVRTTRRVDREISQIASWYHRRSGTQEVAEQWILGLRRLIESLSRDPEHHNLAHESAAFDDDIRELLYGSGRKKTHRVLFRILDGEGVVEIIGVRHFAQRDVVPDGL